MLKCRCRAAFRGVSSLSSPSAINAEKIKQISKSSTEFSSPLEGEEEFLNERERVVEIQERGKNLTSTNAQNDGLKQLFQKAGFTLAEVLITLGIIGVVAAMVLPAITERVDKQITVTRLKKFYSILSQAVSLSEAENGACDEWNFAFSNSDFFDIYLKKYMPVVLDARYSAVKGDVQYIRTNGTVENEFVPFYDNTRVVALKDGTLIFLSTIPKASVNSSTQCSQIFVDINGLQKPNKVGQDFFGFAISNKYKVVPYGTYRTADRYMSDYTREAARSGDYACTTAGRGHFCAALIMIDGWKIADDYPW